MRFSKLMRLGALTLSAIFAAVCLPQPAAAQTVYSAIAWGCALSGTWNSQSVNVGSGSSCITGNLPQSNIDWSGTGAGGTVFTSPGPGQTPTWAAPATPAAPLSCTSAAIGGGLLTVGTCASTTTTCTGARVGNKVVPTPSTYPGDGSDWRSYVSANDQVTTKVCALVAITPASSVYNLAVIQP